MIGSVAAIVAASSACRCGCEPLPLWAAVILVALIGVSLIYIAWLWLSDLWEWLRPRLRRKPDRWL